jgi:hypothetical protein
MYKPGPVLIFPSKVAAASNMGRPSLRTPDTVAKICAAIREDGHTDTHAAALAGVSSSAVSRWRQEDEEFADQLVAARAEYLDARLKEIRGTRKRDGSIDWRAQAWLMQAVAPEVYGTPSRRHALAREREEKQRAEEKADDPEVWSPADLAQLQKWRAYRIHRMNGVDEEEAHWLGHFSQDPNPPPFPGSLAIAGAEIPPEPKLSPEDEAMFKGMRERRLAAERANAERDAAEKRVLEGASGDPAEGASTDESALRAGGEEFQHATNLPESRQAETPNGASRTSDDASHRASSDTYLAELLADYRARNPESSTKLDGDANGANLPKSAGSRRASGDERSADRETGVPTAATRRPLAGAARAAVEAKECRRVNRLLEEEWERSTWRALGAAEATSDDAIPGMQAGF